ncbi:MAG: sortase [Leuconostoc pseudomesenteroides]|uniref:sortase n=1 Tax=Leuconostoc pseudomesenteroides TaxID=33968 RepID=UPI0039E90FE5
MKLRYCLILFVIVIGIIAAIFNKTSEEQLQLVDRIEKRNAKTDAAITDEDANKILLAGAVITVPKINVEYPIFNDTSDESLAKGAGFLEDFDRPDAGKGGLTVIAAHRLWRTHLGFLRLNELGKGDTFQVLYQGVTYHYRVFKKVAIPVSQLETIHDLASPTKSRAALYTCHPFPTTKERLLVVGDLVAVD